MIPTDITMNHLYLVYLFNQDGLIEIQYLFYQGVLVKIDKKRHHHTIKTNNANPSQLLKRTLFYINRLYIIENMFKHS